MKRLLVALLLLLRATNAVDTSRSITIMNQSGRRIDVFWVTPGTGELVPQTEKGEVLNGASTDLNSYVGHTFEVRELPARKSGVCAGEGEVCRIDHFTVNENQDQIVFVREGIVTDHTDSKTVAAQSATKVLEECQSTAKKQLAKNPDGAASILEDLAECVQAGIAKEIETANEEVAFQAEIRKNMADTWENYTCSDDTVNATEPKKEEHWRGKTVKVMIDRPASKIHTIENFLSEEECAAVEEMARPRLHDASVADGSGGSKVSEDRKAKQAGIRVPWAKEADGDPIARLSRRVYDYVNHVLPFDIKENGQEDLMSIQYFGRGPDDVAPDRYMPHCDGECTGLDFKPGNRMATIVMYCDIPKVGGATNFRNAGVHIKPKKYMATFFSYIDAVTMKMDTGFTEHSGCPVIEGEKKIVTQWVRLGVDDANPWSSFNTLGIKHSDAANQ